NALRRSAAITEAELELVAALRAANPQFATLTVEEILAIRRYTGEGWAGINLALRTGNQTSESRAIISGLAKLPGYSGRLVRSESWSIDEAIARYVPGKPFAPEGLLSASRAGAVAQREGNVAITIEAIGKQGKDISALAVHSGTESEVLFVPGARFTVQS